MLCISVFVDAVMFTHNGLSYGALNTIQFFVICPSYRKSLYLLKAIVDHSFYPSVQTRMSAWSCEKFG